MNDTDKLKAALGQYLQTQHPHAEAEPDLEQAYLADKLSPEEERAYRQKILSNKQALDRLLPPSSITADTDAVAADSAAALAQFQERYMNENLVPLPTAEARKPSWPVHLMWLAACIASFFIARHVTNPQGVDTVVRLQVSELQRSGRETLPVKATSMILIELANQHRHYTTYYYTFKQESRVVWSDQKLGPRPDLAVLVKEGKLGPGYYQLEIEGEINGVRSVLSSFNLEIAF